MLRPVPLLSFPAQVLNADDILKDLTDEQRQAVTHVDGPLLIIAGAGSGKTRVITRRVAYLMSLRIPAPSILAITFTNKAAGEMKSRVSQLLDRPLRDFGRLDQPWPIICTFHSLGLRILRHYADRIGLPPNFSVYDSSDQERLIKESIKAADLDTSNFPVSRVHGAISEAKNKLKTAEAYAAAARRFPEDRYARVYRNYENLLRQNNALDFDDLLMRTCHMFRDHGEFLAELQQRFRYILIDEYQDTNHAQYVMAHALAMAHQNIAVVGDPDQSIYAWRGADIQNILDFEKDYPNARVVKLEQNYRSTQLILDVASQLIAHNRQRKEKRLWTENAPGGPARVLVCPNEHEEAANVARQFAQFKEQGFGWGQMAVFYRINALSRVMEDALRRGGIPYRIARGVDFYHRKEIKDVLAYLRVIVNPNDELSLTRIINVPARGIGDAAVEQVRMMGASRGWPLWQALQSPEDAAKLTTRSLNGIRAFVKMVQRWQGMAASLPKPEDQASVEDAVAQDAGAASTTPRIRSLMESVVQQSGTENYLKKIGGEERDELANVGELISSAEQFDKENPSGTLDDYLAQISLVSDLDTLAESGGAVTLMTLHSAKGLEFPVVAIIGMEEEILPHSRVKDHPEQLEEERRLCFVGITRAEQQLILSRATRRMLRGLTVPMAGSRFLREMPQELLEVSDSGDSHDLGDRDGERSLARAESSRLAARFRRGQLVRHAKLGIGRVMDVSNMGQDTRLVVEFSTGRKTLVLPYAPVEPLD